MWRIASPYWAGPDTNAGRAADGSAGFCAWYSAADISLLMMSFSDTFSSLSAFGDAAARALLSSCGMNHMPFDMRRFSSFARSPLVSRSSKSQFVAFALSVESALST